MRGLQTMSRGQRMLMLSLNTSLKATQNNFSRQNSNLLRQSPKTPNGFSVTRVADRKQNVDRQLMLNQNATVSASKVGPSPLTNAEDSSHVVIPDNSHSFPSSGGEQNRVQVSVDRKKRARSKIDQSVRGKQKHPMLSSCGCTRKCAEKISESRRTQVHDEFWSLPYDSRRTWMFSHIKRNDPKKRITNTKGAYSRNCSRLYFIPQENGDICQVCKDFFLRTLGFRSDKVVTVLLKKNVVSQLAPTADQRGRHKPLNKLSDETMKIIKDHIESFHPSISHYRREHAPLRRYLPPELTIREMFNDFVAKHQPTAISYETYRKTVSSLNISFVKLRQEECEACLLYEKHQHDDGQTRECSLCDEWKKHVESARISRQFYQDDAIRDFDPTVAVMSVHMQKVIMLPRIPGVKTCMFTRRLVAFHETFAPLGNKKKLPVISAL